jgi:hypothetical protein
MPWRDSNSNQDGEHNRTECVLTEKSPKAGRSFYRDPLNAMVEWLTLLLCIQEIPVSNLSTETFYPVSRFLWFSSVLPRGGKNSTFN